MPEELFGFKCSTENSAGTQYLVLDLVEGGGSQVIGYQVEMIANNDVPGLLNIDIRRRDDQIKIYYSVDDYIPLDVYLDGAKITRDDFILFVNHLKNIMNESNRYLLNQNSILLSEKYIYVRKGLRDIALLYIPAEINQDIDSALKNLLKSLIDRFPGIDHRDPVMVQFLDYLREGKMTVSGLDRFIKQIFVCREITDSTPGHSGPGRTKHSAPIAPEKADPGPSPGVSGTIPGGTKMRPYILGAIAAAVTLTAALSIIREGDPVVQAAGLLIILGSIGAVLYIYQKTKGAAGAGTAVKIADRPGKKAVKPVDSAKDSDISPRRQEIMVPVIYQKSGESEETTFPLK